MAKVSPVAFLNVAGKGIQITCLTFTFPCQGLVNSMVLIETIHNLISSYLSTICHSISYGISTYLLRVILDHIDSKHYKFLIRQLVLYIENLVLNPNKSAKNWRY